MGKLLEELKRRKVFRVAALYGVVAWVLIQVADTVLPALQMPQWTVSFVTVLFILGFLPTLIAAWAYEVTPDGIKPDSAPAASHPPAQGTDRNLIYATFAMVLLVVGFQISDRFIFTGQLSNTPLQTATNSQSSSVLRSTILLGHPLPPKPIGIATFLDLSSDGSELLYDRQLAEGRQQLVHRNLATEQSRVLAETRTIGPMHLSPDGEKVLFSSAEGFSIVALQNRTTQQIVVENNFDSAPAQWLSDDKILHSTPGAASFAVKTISSGLDDILFTADSQVIAYPHLLPGNEAFLYTTANPVNMRTPEIQLYDIANKTKALLIRNGSVARYASSGHIVFMREGDLWAVPFDLTSFEVTGREVKVVENIANEAQFLSASFTFSESGRLVYIKGTGTAQTTRGFSWVDRLGNRQEIPLPAGNYSQPVLSPDGQSLAFVSTLEGGATDIWVSDLVRGATSRRTFTNKAITPKWMFDGSAIAYSDISNGIWSINADGSGQPEKLSQTFQAFAMSFSSAAESLLVVNGAFDNNSISTLQRVDDTWVSSPLLSAPYTLDGATVSPNGRWLAFTSRETGRDEIYIRPFADIDNGKWQVSIQGGREPEWSTSGDELFYLQPDGDNSSATLMAVAIANPNGNSPIPDSPQALLGKIIFEIDIPGSYVPSNDGSRFIVRSETNNGATRVNMGNGIINVVENWFDELKRLAPPDLQ